MQRFFFLIIIATVMLSVASLSGCGRSLSPETCPGCQEDEDFEEALALIDRWLSDTLDRSTFGAMDTMPNDDIHRIRVNCPPGKLREVFLDSNYLHYNVAQNLGIDPLDFYDSLNTLPLLRRPLERISSTPYYRLDNLRHSYPYLVPEARRLLDDIGRHFHDTLRARGGGDYRLKVTSLLRTPRSVSSLRRVNRASVDSSAHLFGTTFDISFTFFPYAGGVHNSQEDLKNLLAEILSMLRNQGRCYVIYEHRPGCFHITARH